jgi:hypothetical protein
MPAEEIVAAWIAQYGHIFHLVFDETVFLFRRLTRREYRLVLGLEDEVSRSEQVCETCVLWPQAFAVTDSMIAGLPDLLCTKILEASGYVDIKAVYEEAMERVNREVEEQMAAMIEYTFPSGLPFTRFEDWNNSDFFESYAKAKWALENIQGVKIEEQSEGPAKKKRRTLGDPTVMNRIGQRIEPDPQEAPDLGGIPAEFDTGKMANRPINEVTERYNKTQRMIELRKAASKS